MKLTFLGTRACIDARTAGHARHSSLLVSHRGLRLLLDCGSDWLGTLGELQPDAVILTHAHPDHAGGLERGHPGPVWATAATWDGLAPLDLPLRRTLPPGEPVEFDGLTLTAIPVGHSLRAPAVALRLAAGRRSLLYAPDVANLPDPAAALAGVDLYVGDGTAPDGTLLRLEGNAPCGHASFATQLAWCAVAGVRRLLLTHCGEALMGGEAAALREELEATGRKRGVEVKVAVDGLEIVLI